MTIARILSRRIGDTVNLVSPTGFETGPVEIVDAVDVDTVVSVKYPDGSFGVIALGLVFAVKEVSRDEPAVVEVPLSRDSATNPLRRPGVSS